MTSNIQYVSDLVDSMILQFIDMRQLFKNSLDLLMNIYYTDVEFADADSSPTGNHVIINKLIDLPNLCKIINHKLRTNSLEIRSLMPNTADWVILPNDYMKSKYYRAPKYTDPYDDKDVITSIAMNDIFNMVRQNDIDVPSLFTNNEVIEFTPATCDDDLIFATENDVSSEVNEFEITNDSTVTEYYYDSDSEYEAVVVSDFSEPVSSVIPPDENIFLKHDENEFPKYDENHKPSRKKKEHSPIASDGEDDMEIIGYDQIYHRGSSHSEVFKSDMNNYLNDDPSFYL